MRGKGLAWCRVFSLCLGICVLSSRAGGEIVQPGRGIRLLLPPFYGSADAALGMGLSDLLGSCLERLTRVDVVMGREVFQRVHWDARWRGLYIGEATELGRRLRAHVVLLVRYALNEDRLRYEVSVGDLQGGTRWRQLPVSEEHWSEAHRIHLQLVREVFPLVDPPPLDSEERRVVTACGRPFPSQDALALHGQARLQERKGETATNIYARAAAASPGFALPFFRQAELFERLGSRWRAAEAYRRVVRTDEDFVEAYKRLGDLLAKSPSRLFDQAVVAYQTAVEVDPGYAEAYVGLGDALAALGKVDGAVRAYRQGLSVDPWSVRAHVGLAKVYYTEKELYHEAVAEYEKALALDPTFVEAHYGFGDLLEEKGLYEKAIVRYRYVLDLEPRHTGALFAIARAYEKVDVHEAIARWEHYLEVASELPSEKEWIDIARGHLEKLRRPNKEGSSVE